MLKGQGDKETTCFEPFLKQAMGTEALKIIGQTRHGGCTLRGYKEAQAQAQGGKWTLGKGLRGCLVVMVEMFVIGYV